MIPHVGQHPPTRGRFVRRAGRSGAQNPEDQGLTRADSTVRRASITTGFTSATAGGGIWIRLTVCQHYFFWVASGQNDEFRSLPLLLLHAHFVSFFFPKCSLHPDQQVTFSRSPGKGFLTGGRYWSTTHNYTTSPSATHPSLPIRAHSRPASPSGAPTRERFHTRIPPAYQARHSPPTTWLGTVCICL